MSHPTTTEQKDNPLLDENPQRYVMFPIHHEPVWDMYKKAVASFWTVEEIDLSNDLKDYLALTPDEQHFIEMILAFFAVSDGLVIENLASRFIKEVQLPEARAFYGFQVAMENIHSETYSLLIDTYIKNPQKRQKLFEAVQSFPTIQTKAQWCQKYIDSPLPFAFRLAAFAIVEGVFFSGSFCSIFWLKKRGKMPGLTFSNDLISRDEGLHTDFACLLFHMLPEHLLPTPQEIHAMISEAVQIESQFVTEALPVALLGMNAESMTQYIQFVADRLLVALGYEKLWNVTNPFDWMEMISIQGRSNFFERRVPEYKRKEQVTTHTSEIQWNNLGSGI